MIHKIYQWTLTNSHCLDCQRDLGNNTLTRLICEVAKSSNIITGTWGCRPQRCIYCKFCLCKIMLCSYCVATVL